MRVHKGDGASLSKRERYTLGNDKDSRRRRQKIFVVMTAISLGGVLILAAGTDVTGAEADFVLLGHAAEVTAPWFACRSKDDVQFLKDASGHSMAAARRYAAAKGCVVLHTGEAGIFEDASVWSGNSCIRTPGKKHCYWFPDRFIRNTIK